jgi:nucleoside phosphorylase
VVATPAEKRELRERSGAVAVDMESSIILEAAQAAGCPSLVIRGVSDDARHALPRELISLITPEGRLRRARAVTLAIIRPGAIPKAITLQRNTKSALKAVARLLASLSAL